MNSGSRNGMQAADVMSQNVVTTRPDATLEEAAHLMIGQRVSGLPVIDSGGSLVGMLTEADLLERIELGTQGPRPGRLTTFLSHPAGQRRATFTRTVARSAS